VKKIFYIIILILVSCNEKNQQVISYDCVGEEKNVQTHILHCMEDQKNRGYLERYISPIASCKYEAQEIYCKTIIKEPQ